MEFEVNNHKYKILYLDTNALTYFVKYDEFARALLEKYTLNNYAFATNIFNILELYKTEVDFHKKIQQRLDNLPFLILNGYNNIVNAENEDEINVSKLVLFAIGKKPLFNVNFSDLKHFIDNSAKQLIDRDEIVNQEINDWLEKRLNINPQWQKQYNNNIKKTMNQLVKSFGLDFEVNIFGRYKSLECMAFIKNKFCNEKPTEIIKNNSIFDMYNAAVFPYVDVYITERTVGSWLKEFRNKCSFQCASVLHISDLYIPR